MISTKLNSSKDSVVKSLSSSLVLILYYYHFSSKVSVVKSFATSICVVTRIITTKVSVVKYQ
jgi:hypothetical protein